MSDTLGNITITETPVSGIFPLISDYPFSWTENREIAVHRFLLGDGKAEQRFLLGSPGRIFTFKKLILCPEDKAALVAFWEANQGVFGRFFYEAPQENGSTYQYVVRFKDQTLTLDGVVSSILTTGLEFVEVGLNDSSNTAISAPYPNYPLNGTLTRYPDDTLAAALCQPKQEWVPLLKITTKKSGYPIIYLSDRRCMVGTQLYLARILKRSPIDISLNGQSSPVSFTLGNADQAFTLLVDDVNLQRADVEFSLYHVATGIKLDFWKGYIINFSTSESPEFTITAAEGLYELTLAYPTRKQTRLCFRIFGNAGTGCPYGAAKPGGGVWGNGKGSTFCDKGFATPNGCQSNGMDAFFGGINVNTETIRVKDNTTGVFGIGRQTLSVTSEVSSTIYDEVLPEVYCNYSADADTTMGIPVNCFIATGTDEGDFYSAIGIVCAGPIGAYAAQTGDNANAFLLDGQPNHGWPINNYGLRRSYGHNPAQDNDPDQASQAFALSSGGSGVQHYDGFDYNQADPNWYHGQQVGGVAFVQIRRVDAKGLQVDTLADHSMQVVVRQGLGGYKWTAPGASTFTTVGMNEPVWIMVNAVLRALGIYGNPPLAVTDNSILEAVFDVASAVYAATQICDITVPVFVGGNPGDTETQFKYTGVFQQQQSLKDWLVQIANVFLGYWVFAFGKVKIGVRENASVVSAYTIGNVLLGSDFFDAKDFNFNRLVANYADEEFLFSGNSIEIYDEFHAKLVGTEFNPKFLPNSINYSGVSTKSQAGRLITARLREEISGYGAGDRLDKYGNSDPAATFSYARSVRWKSTTMAIGDEPGMIVSIETNRSPFYPATASDNYLEPHASKPLYAKVRIAKMTLNEDYSIDFSGDTVHDDNYALVGGPKPADILATPLPEVNEDAPANWKFFAITDRKGTLGLRGFAVGTNSLTIAQGSFDIYYVDEPSEYFSRCIPADTTIDDSQTSFSYEGGQPVPGEWVMLEDELMEVVSVVPQSAPDEKFGTVTVKRGVLGTQASAHSRVSTTISAMDANNHCKLTVGTGLNLHPGSLLFFEDGSQLKMIGSYDPLSGTLYVTLPFDGDPTGTSVYSDIRMWRVKLFNRQVTFPPRFFQTPQLANYADNIAMPQAGIVMIRGSLTNYAGRTSNVLTLLPVSSDTLQPKYILPFHPVWPYRVRTLGNHRIVMGVQDLEPGSYTDLYPKVPPAEAEVFDTTKATALKGAGIPIETPPALQAIIPGNLSPSGSVSFTGSPGVSLVVQIHITGNNSNALSSLIWIAADHGIDDSSTWLDVTSALADWLNTQDDKFSAYYTAAGGFSNTVTIQDNLGYGGTVSADVSGGYDAAAVCGGFTSKLQIYVGRKYAIAFIGAGFRSGISALSPSSGPSGDAGYFILRDLPLSADTNVTALEIYATPDGQDGPLQILGTISMSAINYIFLDALTEPALEGQSPYAGVTQPSASDDCTVTVKKRGNPWYKLYIPANKNISNELHGFALLPITTDDYISADVDDNIATTTGDTSPPTQIGIDLFVELN